MRILYGVTGEGMGHATRSKVTIQHLVRTGHSVHVVVSGRAFDFLSRAFAKHGDSVQVTEIKGLDIKYLDGAMDRDATVARTVLHAPERLFANMSVYYDAVKAFGPQAVISDFESFAYLYSVRHGLPCISIDNQQIISRCRHDDAILDGHNVDFQATKAFVKLKLPGCTHYVITTFFYPEIKSKYAGNTTLVPPILRDEVLSATPTDAGHILVYQTALGDSRLIDTLNLQTSTKFIVYGLRRDELRGNCTIKNFSEQGFIDDLASAHAVIANGGLSLIGEALHLGKPVYSVPVRHQFEQVMNARYLTRLGFGMTSEEFDETVLGAFLKDASHFARRVKSDHKSGRNAVLFNTVDAVLRALQPA